MKLDFRRVLGEGVSVGYVVSLYIGVIPFL